MTRRSGPYRPAGRELWTVIALLLGLGDDDPTGAPVRRGAAFLAVQVLLAVGLAAVVALSVGFLRHGDAGSGWFWGLLLPVLPLLAGVARTPPGFTTALAAALPAGLATGALLWFALGPVVSGYWLWFAAIATGALVAGPVFGALAPDEPARFEADARDHCGTPDPER